LHVANRELSTIEKVNNAGDVQLCMDSGCEVAFNIWEHPHLDHGYAVTSHSSQGQTADPVLIHVDTEKSQLLVNNRFAYVSVSRAQYDAKIYTNNRRELARDLSRDLTQRAAIASQEPEPAALANAPPSSQQSPTREQKDTLEIAPYVRRRQELEFAAFQRSSTFDLDHCYSDLEMKRSASSISAIRHEGYHSPK
jgi:hypothetical protein